MTGHWLITWTSYGSRLPGDPRGTTSAMRREGARQAFNTPGEAHAGDEPALHAWTSSALRERPVALTKTAAAIVLRELVKMARHADWQLLAAAVMVDHVHVVVGLSAESDRVSATDAMRRFKAYATRALNRELARREQWWTRAGSRRALASDRAVAAAVRYVANQRDWLAMLVAPAWTEVVVDRGSAEASGG